jgi:peptidoglycan/LPS O-acetylase OafA/YrhL
MREQGEIRALTGLRGVAATLVAAYHFYPVAPQSGVWSDTLGRGYLWVDLFFGLSGFVLASNYGAMFTTGFSGASFARFLQRRLARVYPLYAVVLVLQVALTLLLYGDFAHRQMWAAAILKHPLRDIGANLLMVQAWGLAKSVTGQAWSISIEWAAYMAFPLLVAAVLSGQRRVVVAAGGIALLLLALVAELDLTDGAYHSGAMDAYDGARITPLLRCFGDFTLGLLAARASQMPRIAAVIGRDDTGLLIVAAIAAMFALGAPDLAICASFPLLVLALALHDGPAAALLANPLVHRLGVLSYASYLLHGFFQLPLQRLTPLIGGTSASIACWGALLLLADAAYRFIEMPGRRALRRLPLVPA